MKYVLLICLAVLIQSCQGQPKIYEWRGDHRNGIYNEPGLMKKWPKSGPEEKWSVQKIGNGYGSPVIAGDKLYITGEIDSMAILFCFDLEGNKVWQADFGREWTESYAGSRSAPTVVDNLLYVSSGMGNLYCFNVDNQAILWKKEFEEDFQGVFPMFGHSEAVLTYNDMLFWTPGGEEKNVVALNRFTGDLIWSNPGFRERSGYNSPRLIELKERSVLVTFSAYHLMGFDVETGELLWSHEQDNYPVSKRRPGYGDTHSNTVLFEDGAVFYAAGDGNCGVRLDLSPDGTEIKEVWRNKGFDSYMGGIVKMGDYLYGSGTAEKKLFSINALTGQLSDSLSIGSGALIAADERIYYYTHRGTMNLVSYDEGKMELVSSFRIRKGSKEHFSHPVIHNGVLYQRHGNALMAYNIKTQKK